MSTVSDTSGAVTPTVATRWRRRLGRIMAGWTLRPGPVLRGVRAPQLLWLVAPV
ncbi:hypothetical protein ACFU76_22885 [Streptomyces sp. NPDC057539]|uniref:hypothetical protein n=1 Tax=Streptomyces sp. NPDC057539 TaxID=3346159 RepID=UPI0036B2F6C0